MNKQVGFPIKLSGSPASLRLPPPELGEHNVEVLSMLGYSPAEIEGFEREGAI
jgi:crotonobetainyl-CoA:carnitine CoA-transferase CaiB-like acyl-CoA transferase